MSSAHPAKRRVAQGEKLRGAEKVRAIPMVEEREEQSVQRKPDWIRVRVPSGGQVQKVKNMVRQQKLATVCEEAACPNLPECFGGGTATFMVMGEICTRRCSFCDVGFGRPNALDPDEPRHLAESVRDMGLSFVVITSVDRDDLGDGGAQHFVDCIREVRAMTPDARVEILTPDFRPCIDTALDLLTEDAPDVFNHNIETVPHLYKWARPGAKYDHSLALLRRFGERRPDVPTKSGIMVGLGETNEQILETLQDLRDNDVNMVTIGQYLQPSQHHAPVDRFVHPDDFRMFAEEGRKMGFHSVSSGPMVRSSYKADRQFAGEDVGVPEAGKWSATAS